MKITKRNIVDAVLIIIAILAIIIGLFLLCGEAYSQEITSVTYFKNGNILTKFDNGVHIITTKNKGLIYTYNNEVYIGFYTDTGFCLKPIGTDDKFYDCYLNKEYDLNDFH